MSNGDGKNNSLVGSLDVDDTSQKDCDDLYQVRSPEVQEIIGTIPPWITRWGITIIGLLTVALFLSAYYLKYPITVNADVILYSQGPLEVKARADAPIYCLLAKNNDFVEEGKQIAILKSDDVAYQDVISAKSLLQRIDTNVDELKHTIAKDNTHPRLGTMATTYDTLLLLLQNYLQATDAQRGRKMLQLRNEANMMREKIATWEGQYVIRSPSAGRVMFLNRFTENSDVRNGEIIAAIVPASRNNLTVTGYVKAKAVYKILPGQRVNIRLLDFPPQEFGFLQGTIKNILPVEINGYYPLDITLLKGWLAMNEHQIPFRTQYKGVAEITIQNKSVLSHWLGKASGKLN